MTENQMTKMTEQEFMAIWHSQATDEQVLEYRLYYDDHGWPLHYSTQQEPGNYIVVDQETYLNSPKHVRVINGKLKIVKVIFGKKLVPASTGQLCDPTDVAVVVSDNQPHSFWTIKHEEVTDDETY